MLRTNLSRCPNNDLPTALSATHHRLAALIRRRKLATDLDHHLRYEHASLDILTREALALHKLERMAGPSTADLKAGNQERAMAVKEMDLLRLQAKRDAGKLITLQSLIPERLISLPWLLCQLSYSKWWMTIRNLWFSYRIPTPLLHGTVFDEWIEGMTLAAQASADMISLCLEEGWSLASFPKAIGTAVVLCYHTLSMGVAHFAHQSPSHPLPQVVASVIDKLPTMRIYLEEACPALRFMVLKTQSTLEDYKRHLCATNLVDESSHTVPFSFNEFADPFGTMQWDPIMEMGQWNWQQQSVWEDLALNND